MKTKSYVMVRVYLTESEHSAQKLLEYLHESRVRGATLYRGISGFGASGVMHRADWLAISGDLPLVLEFTDTPETVEAILPGLLKDVEQGHVVKWPVECVEADCI